MSSIPKIQIRQQYARIGMETTPNKLEITQPKVAFELNTTAPVMNIRSPKGELDIDQSRAWSALAIGSHLETMNTIYDVIENVVLTTIARIAQEGDQMAAIHNKSNAIADIARDRSVDLVELDFAGIASVDNVDIRYTAREVELDSVPGKVDIKSRPYLPEFDPTLGKLNIYMLQRNKVDIIPPQIDMQI